LISVIVVVLLVCVGIVSKLILAYMKSSQQKSSANVCNYTRLSFVFLSSANVLLLTGYFLKVVPVFGSFFGILTRVSLALILHLIIVCLCTEDILVYRQRIS